MPSIYLKFFTKSDAKACTVPDLCVTVARTFSQRDWGSDDSRGNPAGKSVFFDGHGLPAIASPGWVSARCLLTCGGRSVLNNSRTNIHQTGEYYF
jgi:hypothetical protein